MRREHDEGAGGAGGQTLGLGVWSSIASFFGSVIQQSPDYQKLLDRVGRDVRGRESVLEVGCRTGLLTLRMAKEAKNIVATDCSSVMVESARTRALVENVSNVTFEVANVHALPYAGGSFDAVVCCNVLQDVEQPDLALSECRRVLRSDGVFIAPTPCQGEHLLRFLFSILRQLGDIGICTNFSLGSLVQYVTARGFLPDISEGYVLPVGHTTFGYVIARPHSKWIRKSVDSSCLCLCDICTQQIKDGDTFWDCGDCADFQMCDACHSSSTHHHDHPLIRANRHPAGVVEEIGRQSTIAAKMESLCWLNRERPCLGVVRSPSPNPQFTWTTFGEMWDRSLFLAAGLCQLCPQLNVGSAVIIACSNSIEWLLADVACTVQGWTSVVISPPRGVDDVTRVLAENKAPVIFCDASDLAIIQEAIVGVVTELPWIVVRTSCTATEVENSSWRAEHHQTLGNGEESHESSCLINVNEVEMLGRGCGLPARTPGRAVHPGATFTVVYSSGSTGHPKGTAFSQILWADRLHLDRPTYLANHVVWFSFAPLAHNLDRVSTWTTLFAGGRVGISSGEKEYLMAELKAVRPTKIAATPRFWIELHRAFEEDLKCAIDLLSAGGDTEGVTTAARQEAEDLLHRRYEVEALGGRQDLIVTGGALTPPEVLRFLRTTFCCPVYDSYGSTEVGAIWRNGFPCDGVEVRLEDMPELGHTSECQPPAGQVCVRRKAMIDHYVGQRDGGGAGLIDGSGFFRTGDMAIHHPDGHYELIDRVQNLFKLGQGEFVSPLKVELALESSEWCDQAFVTAELFRDQVVAVIVPRHAMLRTWWREHLSSEEQAATLPSDVLCEQTSVVSHLLSVLSGHVARKGLAPYEVPAAIHVESVPFSVSNVLLTPSMKLNRPLLRKKYAETIKALYVSAGKNGCPPEMALDVIAQGVESDAPEKCHLLSASFAELGGDSLAAARLSQLLETRYDRFVSARLLLSPQVRLVDVVTALKRPLGTVGSKNLDSVLLTMQNNGMEGTESPAYWEAEARMPDDLLRVAEVDASSAVREEESANHPSAVLLTGPTGFLGPFLLDALWRQYTPAPLYVLSRTGAEQARQRITALLSECGLLECAAAVPEFQRALGGLKVVVDMEKRGEIEANEPLTRKQRRSLGGGQ